MLHDAISSWRTADITQADKENLFHFFAPIYTAKILIFDDTRKKRKIYFP
jgi:hypothetical protein